MGLYLELNDDGKFELDISNDLLLNKLEQQIKEGEGCRFTFLDKLSIENKVIVIKELIISLVQEHPKYSKFDEYEDAGLCMLVELLQEYTDYDYLWIYEGSLPRVHLEVFGKKFKDIRDEYGCIFLNELYGNLFPDSDNVPPIDMTDLKEGCCYMTDRIYNLIEIEKKYNALITED